MPTIRNVWSRPSWRLIVTDEPNSTTSEDEFLFTTWAVACLAPRLNYHDFRVDNQSSFHQADKAAQ